MPAKSAGSSITVTCASARLRSAAATLTTPIRGNGLAGSTPAAIRESTKRAPPKRSTRPAVSSKRHGQCFHRSELRPTFRNGAISGIGLPRDTAASIAASKITERQSVQVAPKGIGHRPDGGISAAVRFRFPFPARSPAHHPQGCRELTSAQAGRVKSVFIFRLVLLSSCVVGRLPLAPLTIAKLPND